MDRLVEDTIFGEIRTMKRTLILGLGNPILSDDAVGIRTVEKIEKLVGKKDGIDYVKDSVAGLRILDIINGYDKLIIVDAVEKGGKPGTLYKIPLSELDATIHLTSLHSINFAAAIKWGKEMGFKIPEDISIYGIEIIDVVNFSEKMTPEVQNSVERNALKIAGMEFR